MFVPYRYVLNKAFFCRRVFKEGGSNCKEHSYFVGCIFFFNSVNLHSAVFLRARFLLVLAAAAKQYF